MTWELYKDFYAQCITPGSKILKIGTLAFHNSNNDSIFSKAELLAYKHNLFQLILYYNPKKTEPGRLAQVLASSNFNPNHFLQKNCDYLRVYTVDRDLIGVILQTLILVQEDIANLLLYIDNLLETKFIKNPKLIPWITEGTLDKNFYPVSNNKNRKVTFKNIFIQSLIPQTILSKNSHLDITTFQITVFYSAIEDAQMLLTSLQKEGFPYSALKKEELSYLEVSTTNKYEIIRLLGVLSKITPNNDLDSLKSFVIRALKIVRSSSKSPVFVGTGDRGSPRSPVFLGTEERGSPPPLLLRAPSPQYLQLPPSSHNPSPPKQKRNIFKRTGEH